VPVRARIVAFYALIVALVFAGASVFLLSRLGSDLDRAVDAGLRSRAAVIVRDVREEFGDLGKREGLIDETEVVAQILHPSGRVLETTKAIGPDPLLSARAIAPNGSSACYERNVRVRGKLEPTRLLATRASNGLVVVVGAPVKDNREALAALARMLLIGGPIMLVLTSAAVWALAGVALRPVEKMRSEAEALSSGIEGRRLPVPNTNDEIARLADTLNNMLGRLEQALERERRFVDDASHELRTPLAVLKTELELALRKSRTRDELEAAVRSAAEEVDGLATLAEHLLLLARADHGLLATHRTRVDVTTLVDQVKEGFALRARDRGVTLDGRTASELWIDADPVLVRQAVSNLIDNAIEHTPAGGAVSVEITQQASGYEIAVTDSGPGFDDGFLPKAFEPFAHGDGSRAGVGLGLAIVRAIADAHGGTVAASNRDGGGARVALSFPR
jgi:heavy metal sensor kinase